MLDYTYLADKNKQLLLQRSNNTVELVLLQRITFQDRDAFHEIFCLYYPRLQRFFSLLINSPQLIDELSNDVMLAVWQKSIHFNGRLRVSTWIFAIAYKKTLKSIKNLALNPAPITKESARPQHKLSIAQPVEQIQDALAQLTFEHQAVILLTYVYGYSPIEIAAIMTCPLHIVKSRMIQARSTLHDLLPHCETEYETESL